LSGSIRGSTWIQTDRNKMHIPHIRQTIAEMGPKSDLAVLSPEARDALVVGLRELRGSMIVGDFAFFYRNASPYQPTFYPAIGIVTEITDTHVDLIVDAEGEKMKVRFGKDGRFVPWAENAFEDMAPTMIELSELLPFSRAATRNAWRLMRQMRPVPTGPFYGLTGGRASSYIVTELRNAAGALLVSMGLPYPGLISAVESENRPLRHLCATLPGRDGDHFSSARGYTGWGPYEDYARTLELDGAATLRPFLEANDLQVFDFYFGLTNASVDCPFCNASGINADFSELQSCFYPHNQGRWTGWGAALTQDEVDTLAVKDRLHAFTHVYISNPAESDVMSEAEVRERTWLEGDLDTSGAAHYLEKVEGGYRLKRGWLRHKDGRVPRAQEINDAFVDHSKRGSWSGHDGINVHFATKVRARALGISTDECTHCEGSAYVSLGRETLELNLWAGIENSAAYLQIQVNDIDPADLEGIRALLKEHHAKITRNLGALADHRPLHRNTMVDAPGGPVPDEGWRSDMNHADWTAWIADMNDSDLDLNLIFGVAYSPALIGAEDQDPTKLHDQGGLCIYLAHPRKGAVRAAYVHRVSEADRTSIVEYLGRSIAAHAWHFAWAIEEPKAEKAA
jgi:hypothetical protein